MGLRADIKIKTIEKDGFGCECSLVWNFDWCFGKSGLHTKELKQSKAFFLWFMLPAFASLVGVTHLWKECCCEHTFLTLYFWQTVTK